MDKKEKTIAKMNVFKKNIADQSLREDMHRLIYMWVKEGNLNLKEFDELLNYIADGYKD